jgi:hypothetical protein
MKTFTDKPLHQFDQVKYDNIACNLDKHLDQFNGGLDSNNLPVESIDATKLANPSVLSVPSSVDVTKHSLRCLHNLTTSAEDLIHWSKAN